MRPSTLFAAVSLSFIAASAGAQTPTTTPADQTPPTINQRLENQRDREQAGVKDDQLTKGETTHLRADDAAIRAQEKVYRKANDGKLTKGERKQLNKELNRTSNQIYRDRHNNRKPKS
jgi:hypothetical protein